MSSVILINMIAMTESLLHNYAYSTQNRVHVSADSGDDYIVATWCNTNRVTETCQPQTIHPQYTKECHLRIHFIPCFRHIGLTNVCFAQVANDGNPDRIRKPKFFDLWNQPIWKKCEKHFTTSHLNEKYLWKIPAISSNCLPSANRKVASPVSLRRFNHWNPSETPAVGISGRVLIPILCLYYGRNLLLQEKALAKNDISMYTYVYTYILCMAMNFF